jgi:hypothetical protein
MATAPSRQARATAAGKSRRSIGRGLGIAKSARTAWPPWPATATEAAHSETAHSEAAPVKLMTTVMATGCHVTTLGSLLVRRFRPAAMTAHVHPEKTCPGSDLHVALHSPALKRS